MSDVQAFVAAIVLLVAVCVGVGITQWLYGHAVAREMKRVAAAVETMTYHVQKLHYSEAIRDIEGKLDRIEKNQRIWGSYDETVTESVTEPTADKTDDEADLDELGELARNYSVGKWASEGVSLPTDKQRWDKAADEANPVGREPEDPPEPEREPTTEYVMNTSTGALHLPSCGFVRHIAYEARLRAWWTHQELIDQIDDPRTRQCSRCRPLTKGVA